MSFADPRSTGPAEAVERTRLEPARKAGALVLDMELDELAGQARRELDRAATVRQCVVDEVQERAIRGWQEAGLVRFLNIRYVSLRSSKYRSRLIPEVRRRFLMMNTGMAR